MPSVLDRKLLVITGKGGVGKTTMSAAIGLLAAGRGLRTIVVEVGDQGRLPGMFEHRAREPGVETRLQEHLWSISIDPDRALEEWLQALGGRVSGRVLASSGAFQYFAAAAPGAKEIISMVKVWELTQDDRWRRRSPGYDLVVLDAPATGHALGMLRSPQTFGAIARVGPVAGQAQQVGELLGDPARTGYLAVRTGDRDGGHRDARGAAGPASASSARMLDAVIVNCLLPQRFSAAELERIAKLAPDGRPRSARAAERVGAGRGHRSADTEVIRAAAQAARTVHERARFQHNQVARLRRQQLRR